MYLFGALGFVWLPSQGAGLFMGEAHLLVSNLSLASLWSHQ